MENMNMKKITTAIALMVCVAGLTAFAAEKNPEAKQFKYSTTIEKERPELDETTLKLISEYRRNPTEANRVALKKQVEKNYDAVLAKKKAKLAELKKTARHDSKIEEMQVIVDEMIRDRDARVEQSMKRFSDPRLKPGSRDGSDGYHALIGAGENVSISHTPVTNEEYAAFIKATGYKAPADWKNGTFPKGKERHPVVNVSNDDAVAYCKWLTKKDGKATYRLPTEVEWEFAAGHMPKDADFNCGEAKTTTPVDKYAKTLAACGAIDVWGNVWEWTSTKITEKETIAVKGGAFDSGRTNCRTENRGEGRKATAAYPNVGFRVVRQK